MYCRHLIDENGYGRVLGHRAGAARRCKGVLWVRALSRSQAYRREYETDQSREVRRIEGPRLNKIAPSGSADRVCAVEKRRRLGGARLREGGRALEW
jgi:hypothetical protein